MADVIQNIRFSIVIPLYNKADFVAKTIESALSQTYSSFEIIIVDDGSTDNSLEIVQKLKDDRVKVYSKPNGGVSSARNYGIEKANNEYVAFLDADDTWENTFLEQICLLIEKYPEASVFCTNYAFLYSSGKMFVNNKKDLPEGFWDDYFQVAVNGDCVVWTSACCVRKVAFTASGTFTEKYSRGEDLEMWFRLAQNNKFAYCAKALSFYNKSDQSSATSSNKINPEKSWIDNIDLRKYANNPNISRYLKRLIAQRLISYLTQNQQKSLQFIIKNNGLYWANILPLLASGIKLRLKRRFYKLNSSVNKKQK